MRVGNKIHSWKEWKKYLEDTLNKATLMKRSQCTELSTEILKTFDLPVNESNVTLRPVLHSLNVLLGNSIILVFLKWYGDIISSTDDNEKWIVATNRESERFISILKQCLDQSSHIKEVIINAYMRLRFLKFTFTNDIPQSLQSDLIKRGRELYNDATTRKEMNSIKKQHHDKCMEEALVKFQQKMREQRILAFMQDCGAEIQPKTGKKPGSAPKISVTVDNLKEFLGKLKRHDLYSGEVNQRLKDHFLIVIETQMMPKGSAFYRTAYITK